MTPLEEGRPADFARLKRAQGNLAFINLVLKTAIEATPDGMLIIDAKNRILSFNRHFTALFRVPAEVIAAGLPAGPLERFGASIVEHPDEFIARIRHLNAHPEEIGQERLYLRDGRICDRHSTGLFGADKRYLGRIWFFRDVTEERRAQEQLAAMARCDPLTGLANRAVLRERLEHAIAAAKRGGTGFAVLVIDLDHFKGINDSFGHGAGDRVLHEVGRRLAGAIRETDLAARLGGDEFVVFQAEVEDPVNAGRLATTLRGLLGRPYPLENGEAHLTPSIGIAVYAPDIGTANGLLEQADRALYRAKQQGRDRYRFHSSALDQSVLDRIEIAEAVRAAVATGELELRFQPNVAIATGELSGIDVVVCWRDPVRGLVVPERVLTAADAAAVVPAMAHWALDRACRQFDAWRRDGLFPPPLGLRLSAAELAPARRFDGSSPTPSRSGGSLRRASNSTSATPFLRGSTAALWRYWSASRGSAPGLRSTRSAAPDPLLAASLPAGSNGGNWRPAFSHRRRRAVVLESWIRRWQSPGSRRNGGSRSSPRITATTPPPTRPPLHAPPVPPARCSPPAMPQGCSSIAPRAPLPSSWQFCCR